MKDGTLTELDKYACEEGNELGDLWHRLIDLWEGYSVYMSPEFGKHLENEINLSLEEARNIFAEEMATEDSPPPKENILNRVNEYLMMGGLINPELMNAAAVRDLLIDCRDFISENSHD